ncbi:regulatory protein RecX [Mucilaginibacter sp.]|jgi:regulatory protein|uniref:regulatory protein RecX n=1 Tax=Mucilaginibacter sp. TaxID=1882438 RepID=UPI002C7F6832|nr:RecX family transcriptional regulator [Mucilaginibacter sp.]HTI57411.1 RecX family transcriptional regulator [Mucilaginibacter sp.]
MDQPKPNKITDEKVGLAKAENYCAYQERSQQEVRDKLYEWGLYPNQVENIITRLIENNFLNEARFAVAYATGKFRQKGWGKIKIKQGLKLKKVSEPLIKKALNSIDGDDYLQMLNRIIEKKSATITEKLPYKRRYKLQQYAMSRGFESDLISDVLKEMVD